MEELLHWTIFRLQHRTELHSIKVAHVFDGGESAYYCTKDNQVYYLSMFSSFDVRKTRKDSLCGKNITAFYGDEDRGMALTAEGTVYGWGLNACGQLGDGTKSKRHKPVHCSSWRGLKLTQLALTNDRTFGLTDKGRVVWCGRGSNTVVKNTNAKDIVCIETNRTGEETSSRTSQTDLDFQVICLTKSGQVFTIVKCESEPRHMEAFKNQRIIQIATGKDHVLALSEKGEIYGWGYNTVGQLARNLKYTEMSDPELESTESYVSLSMNFYGSPVEIQGMGKDTNKTRFVEIGCHRGSRTSAALSVTGDVYVWGECNKKHWKTPMKTSLKTLDNVFSLIDKPSTSLRNIRPSNNLPVSSLAFNNPDKSDCTFTVEGKTLYANKSILMLQLPYFETMFSGTWTESSGEITIQDFSYDTYHAFLDFMHNGHFIAKDPFELLRLAHEVQYDALVQEVIDECRRKLTYDTVCTAFHLAKTFGLESLMQSCRLMALTDLTTVLRSRSYASLSPKHQQEFVYSVVENPHAGSDGDGDK